jgi:asparagine synthase (glutamine-hydrolysing)
MPGIAGFIDCTREDDASCVTDMLSYMATGSFSGQAPPFCNSGFNSGYLSAGTQTAYASKEKTHVWVDGEWYSASGPVNAKECAGLLINACSAGSLIKTLSKTNGFFSALIYNEESRIVRLISDRFGLRQLYWLKTATGIAWAGDIKAFLGLNSFVPDADSSAVNEFLDVGYFLENKTWFKDVEILPASAVLTFNAMSGAVEIERYWNWQFIKSDSSVKFDEAVYELGQLFRTAVNRRISGSEKICLTLSGGLDSRAILAAMPSSADTKLYTFGDGECSDIKIARKVAAVRKSRHTILPLYSENWLSERVKYVWELSASCSILHLHGMGFVPKFARENDVSLNGFAGDLVCGGSYLEKTMPDSQIDKRLFYRRTGLNATVEPRFDAWYLINKTDPFFINNRVRRFTIAGPAALSHYMPARMPFVDNDIIDFVYSLPDRFRFHSRLYNAMLLNEFPQYYSDIVWQKTGMSIKAPYPAVAMRLFAKRVVNRAFLESGKIGVKLPLPGEYASYHNWIGRGAARRMIESLLLSSGAYIYEYIDEKRTAKFIRGYFGGSHFDYERIGRLVTAEIWLRQVRNRKPLNESVLLTNPIRDLG